MAQSKRSSRATSYDVAIAAGVAQSTVSRCFQQDSPISPDTRAHVVEVADRLGYRPNAVARSLILGRSNVIGVIVTKYTLRYNPDVLYAIAEALAAQDLKLLLIAVDDDNEVHATLQNTLEFPLDGLISCATMARADIDRFQRLGVPVVFFNRQISAKGVDCVTTDNSAAAREVADALYDAGHRSFLCIGGPEGAPVSDSRVSGFVDRVRERGTKQIEVAYSNFSYEKGNAVMLSYAPRVKGNFDAVFCANDQIALGVLDACRFTLGLKVPQDISIIGFDDIAEASRPTYQLTTVRQQVVDLATEAIRLLATRLSKPEMRSRLVAVPGVLIERASARINRLVASADAPVRDIKTIARRIR
jgi:DNA-binding LacI/PurR family transcriptional regulator